MIPWITSAVTLVAVWLNGRNVRLSWKVSLGNQAIWLVFIATYGAWGLLPLTLGLSGIFARHLWRTRDGATGRSLNEAVEPPRRQPRGDGARRCCHGRPARSLSSLGRAVVGGAAACNRRRPAARRWT